MEREPFKIRAHHLIKTNYYFLEVIEDINKLSRGISFDTEMLLAEEHDELLDRGDIEYVRDLLGDCPKEYINEYNQKLINYFTCFASIPDDYPVHLTNLKDGICLACKIGQHCEEETPFIETEQTGMLHFLKQANLINIKEPFDYTVIRKLDEIIRIETTKKVVLRIAGSIDGNAGMHNLPLPKEVKVDS